MGRKWAAGKGSSARVGGCITIIIFFERGEATEGGGAEGKCYVQKRDTVYFVEERNTEAAHEVGEGRGEGRGKKQKKVDFYLFFVE